MVLWLCLHFLGRADALGGEASPAPQMPVHWKVISDSHVPPEQVKTMSGKLNADLRSVRNTVYDVNGRRVQINVIVAADRENAEKLIVKLRSIKSGEALLPKDRIVYEFVGPNDVLPVIAEGRKHLESR